MFVVLLTNRVHAARAKRPGRVIADVRADLSDAAAFAVTDAEFSIDDKVAYRADKRVGWNPMRSRAARSSRRGKATSSRVARSKKSTTKRKVVAPKAPTSSAVTIIPKRRAG